MSQINDALKRASQAGQKNLTPIAPPPLPLSAEPRSRQLNPVLLGALVLALLLIAALVFSRLWRHPASVPSASTAPLITAATPAPKQIVPSPPPAPPISAAPIASIPAPMAVPPQPLAATPPPPPPPPAPAFPALKLQAIFYSKTPQALLNGQLVSPGDTVSGVRLQSLTPDSATLQWNNQTKTLHLTKL